MHSKNAHDLRGDRATGNSKDGDRASYGHTHVHLPPGRFANPEIMLVDPAGHARVLICGRLGARDTDVDLGIPPFGKALGVGPHARTAGTWR